MVPSRPTTLTRERLASETRQSLLDVVRHLAQVGAEAVRPYFRSDNLFADNKDEAGFDPVTEGDRAVERAIRAALAELRPDDSIRGEEYGAHQGTSGLTWVIDPIDGTRAFLIGAPVWGTLIALCDTSGPFLGAISQPYIGELWIGGFGTAVLERGDTVRSLQPRAPRPLSDALLCTTFPEIGTPKERTVFGRVANQVKLVRYGLDCYGYGLVAAGQVDLVIEAGLADYDICGPQAVVEAAGGIVTTWDGGPAHHGGRVVVAANAEIHAAALDALAWGT